VSDVTPSLEEFRRVYEADSNAWWRLESGHHLNLFDEALDALDAARARIAELEAPQRPPLKYIAGYRSGDYVMIDETTAHHDDPSAARGRARYLTRRDSRAWGVYEIREVRP
jgi:hypothetical protein